MFPSIEIFFSLREKLPFSGGLAGRRHGLFGGVAIFKIICSPSLAYRLFICLFVLRAEGDRLTDREPLLNLNPARRKSSVSGGVTKREQRYFLQHSREDVSLCCGLQTLNKDVSHNTIQEEESTQIMFICHMTIHITTYSEICLCQLQKATNKY